MALGSSGDGEFISKYEKETEGSDKTKRSVKESDETRSGNKMLLPVAQKIAKRSAGILTKAQKRDKTAATTGAVRGPQDLEVEFEFSWPPFDSICLLLVPLASF